MIAFNDYPIEDVMKQAEDRINQCLATGRNAYVHQKWSCQHCGSRQTMEHKNDFHRSGRCEECGQISLITKCNYLFIAGGPANDQ